MGLEFRNSRNLRFLAKVPMAPSSARRAFASISLYLINSILEDG